MHFGYSVAFLAGPGLRAFAAGSALRAASNAEGVARDSIVFNRSDSTCRAAGVLRAALLIAAILLPDRILAQQQPELLYVEIERHGGRLAERHRIGGAAGHIDQRLLARPRARSRRAR